MPGVDETNTFETLSKQASKSKRLWITAPWLTLKETTFLVKGKEDARIIVREEGALDETITDWALVQELSRKPNVQVKTLPNLHAKIWVFDHSAYVGSSNLTPTGLGRHNKANIEYGILTVDPREVENAEKKFLQAWSLSQPLIKYGESPQTPTSLASKLIGIIKTPLNTASKIISILFDTIFLILSGLFAIIVVLGIILTLSFLALVVFMFMKILGVL